MKPSRFGWTKVFGDQILKNADNNPRIIAVTAAMLQPVGLKPMADKYPDRVIDVGIAEQHAVTMCAGLSFAGYHPVFAVYATFLNRGFDQVLMDAALHNEAVTIVLDRAGITGADGPSHNGMWDIALLSIVPHIKICAPRDEQTLRELVDICLDIDTGPTVIRYPKGEIADPLPAVERLRDADIIYDNPGNGPNITIIAAGPLATTATNAAKRYTADHPKANITVVDPIWLAPISDTLIELADKADIIITYEDGLVDGGFGSHLRDAIPSTKPVYRYGIGREFIATANRADILKRYHLDEDSIVDTISDLAQQVIN